MKHYKIICTLVLMYCITSLQAQIPDILYINANQAANALLGPNVTVSNVSFSGNALQLALFTDGMDKLTMPNGIVLTTGDALFAGTHGNSNIGESLFVPNNNGDSDLNILNGPGSVKGPAVLEFDFVTSGTILEFECAFASEEYPEDVNNGFNDAFGIFLSGPGISGNFSNNSINIAQLPNGGGEISVDNINFTTNSSFYINNQFSNPNNNIINESNAHFTYDGYTKVITVSENVQCGQTYHIKIAICNSGDSNKDSGVFFKGGSFRSDFGLGALTTTSPQPICEEGNLNLTVQGDNNLTYTWSTGQSGVGLNSITTVANPNINSYSVTATNQDNCILTRSITVVVHDQINTPPTTKGVNNTGNFTYYIQANTTGCFGTSTFDSADESVSFTSITSLPPGAAIQRDGAFQESGIFCWTPTMSDVGSHSFNVTISDNNVCDPISTTETYTVVVVCEFCPIGVLYENRHPNNNPLLAETEAGQFIRAGTNVDPNQTNGTVETGTSNILFQAGEFISLEPGFTGGPNFTALIDEETCIDDCEDCCEEFTGFTYNFIPNVFTPNGDGINDVWYISDNSNPFCAFNAQGFELNVFNRWGAIVYNSSFDGNSCCPFVSPSSSNDVNLKHSSIFWDGRNNGGGLVCNGTYFYTLKLKGCGTAANLGGYITVFGTSCRLASDTNQEDFENIDNGAIFENEEELFIKPSIYPNPTSSSITIDLILPNSTIEVLTGEGRLLITKQNRSYQETIDLESLSPGIYFIRVTSNEKVFNQKIVKN